MTKVLWMLYALNPSSFLCTYEDYRTFGPFETREACIEARADLAQAHLIEWDIINGEEVAACIPLVIRQPT